MFPVEYVYADWIYWQTASKAKRADPETLTSPSERVKDTETQVEGFCIPRVLLVKSNIDQNAKLGFKEHWQQVNGKIIALAIEMFLTSTMHFCCLQLIMPWLVLRVKRHLTEKAASGPTVSTGLYVNFKVVGLLTSRRMTPLFSSTRMLGPSQRWNGWSDRAQVAGLHLNWSRKYSNPVAI